MHEERQESIILHLFSCMTVLTLLCRSTKPVRTVLMKRVGSGETCMVCLSRHLCAAGAPVEGPGQRGYVLQADRYALHVMPRQGHLT